MRNWYVLLEIEESVGGPEEPPVVLATVPKLRNESPQLLLPLCLLASAGVWISQFPSDSCATKLCYRVPWTDSGRNRSTPRATARPPCP